MKENNYLIAIALLHQNKKRIMPLNGKSLREPITQGEDPGELGLSIALELLLRVWQRSDEGALFREPGRSSLMLVELTLTEMQEYIPTIKQRWLNTGDTLALTRDLLDHSLNIWGLEWQRYERSKFIRIEST